MHYVYRYNDCISFINSEITKMERLAKSIEKNFDQMDLSNVDAKEDMDKIKALIIKEINAQITYCTSKKAQLKSW